MRIGLLLLLFALSSCTGEKGVQKSYIISESPVKEPQIETPKVKMPVCKPY